MEDTRRMSVLTNIVYVLTDVLETNLLDMEEEFRDRVEALDNVLFAATLYYLDPAGGFPTARMAEDVRLVRYMLEDMRERLREGLH